MYATVPTAAPGLVRYSSATPAVTSAIAPGSTPGLRNVSFASPKSRIFACPRLVTKMFAGLMSRRGEMHVFPVRRTLAQAARRVALQAVHSSGLSGNPPALLAATVRTLSARTDWAGRHQAILCGAGRKGSGGQHA